MQVAVPTNRRTGNRTRQNLGGAESLRKLAGILRDLIGVEVEVVFRSRVEGEESTECRDVRKVAAKFEAVIAAIPRQVIAKLMLLLQRLLRHVAVATDEKTVGEDKQIQIGGCVNAVVESLKLVGELVDCELRQRRSQRSQEVVESIQTTHYRPKDLCERSKSQPDRSGRRCSDRRNERRAVFRRKIKVAFDGVLPVVERLWQKLNSLVAETVQGMRSSPGRTPGTNELPRSRVRSTVPKKNALSCFDWTTKGSTKLLATEGRLYGALGRDQPPGASANSFGAFAFKSVVAEEAE